ncbi:MAG TPA: serine/threonine-protein kinase [Kofleriaceae bacterium]|jgi:serine/threonine-protein kinase
MGVVYAAEHTLLGRPAAIKVLLPDYSQKPEIVTRFFNEAKAATAIRHPGIIEIYDFGWSGTGAAFIVMELLIGEPLTTRLKAARIPWHRALQLGRQIAGALSAAHDTGIVHRDLKPDNVFIVRDAEVPGGERIKLLDFGIAKLAGDAHSVSSVTRTGSVIGTPTYMSPEGCRGVTIDSRADIYSLGCVLYELMTGRPPFVGEGSGDVLAAHIHVAPPSLAEHGAQVPPTVERLMRTMLAKSPANRIQSATALIEAIDAELGTRPSQQLPPIPTAISHIGSGPVVAAATMPTTISGSSVSRTVSPSTKRALVPILLAGAAISVIIVFLALSHKSSSEPPESPTVKLATEPVTDEAPTKTETPKVETPQVATPAPTAVKLDIASDPAGARVFFDGALLGTTPFHGHLPIGTTEKELVVKADGFTDKKLSITPDHAIDEVVTLTKIAGKTPKQPTPPSKTPPAKKPGKNDSVNPF